MAPLEPMDIVDRQIERLHSEAMERVKNFSALWRTVILGVAGVLALGDKRDLNLILLLAPQLAMLVLAYWLNEQGSLVVVGRGIAAEEQKLNQIARQSLLTYESDRARARSASRPYNRAFLGSCTLVVSGLYVLATYGCLHSSASVPYQERDDFRLAYLGLSVAAFVAALINVARLWYLGASSDHTKAVSGPEGDSLPAADGIVAADGAAQDHPRGLPSAGRSAAQLGRSAAQHRR